MQNLKKASLDIDRWQKGQRGKIIMSQHALCRPLANCSMTDMFISNNVLQVLYQMLFLSLFFFKSPLEKKTEQAAASPGKFMCMCVHAPFAYINIHSPILFLPLILIKFAGYINI